MAQPVWITPPGSLGTIAEGIFYQIPLRAYEPEVGETVYYELIAGKLPPGIQCEATGLIAGVPGAIANVQGVPQEVNRDVTSKFAVRAYTKKTIGSQQVVNRLADRTFTITVTGPDAPRFTTPAGTVATYFDGSQVLGLQIDYTDTDPDEIIVIRLIAGQLPPGLTLSTSGLISGFIAPDTSTNAPVNFTYEFVLEITDGVNSDLRTFNIVVYNRNSMTADNTDLTSDNTFVTADVTPVRIPILLTPQGSIGTVKNNNFFAFQFDGIDLDGDPIGYILVLSSDEVPGLTLDLESGWLYGYIPDLGLTENVYEFQIEVYKLNDPIYISEPYSYSLTVTGDINGEIIWETPSNLGTIVNGATSTLYVRAVNRGGLALQYQLLSGSDSSLPQGLQLLPSGEIAGRCSFNTFTLDNGTTTFDVTPQNGISRPTTFDLVFSFVVQVTSLNGVVNVTRTFSITVIRRYQTPYNNLYVQAMPPEDDRELINSLLQNSDVFIPDLIYRPTDLNFGVATRVIYMHAFGLTPTTLEDYYSSLYENHYWKNLVLGNIEVAQARNAQGEVIYEVVYSRVIDNLLNDAGQSVSKQVNLAFPINETDSTEISVVYPNSLINMRDQVIDTVGQVGNVLPLWMLSKQADGRVLGFTPAWVLAYAKPTKGEQIAYNIRTQFGSRLNLVDFKVDRYELDALLTKNWDPVTQNWDPTPPTCTTFDINNHYESAISLAGTGYQVNDQIKILGSQVGGVNGPWDPANSQFGNDIVITVTAVNGIGAIQEIIYIGTAPLLSAGDSYNNVIGTNIVGSGTGAQWYVESVPGVETVFDHNSLQFIDPVDMYSNTQAYDKYLVFPKRDILE
jgi:hypothetical protein